MAKRTLLPLTLPLLAAVALCPAAAQADDLVAARASLMCKSARVLARLVDKQGADRTLLHASAGDQALKASGGCVDVAKGTRVTVAAAHGATTTVSVAIGGVAQTYVVASAAFTPAPPAPEDAASDAPTAEADATPDAAAAAPDTTPPAAAPLPATPPATAGGEHRADIAVTGLMLGMTEDDARTVLGPGYEFRPEGAFADPASEHIAATGPDPDNTYRLAFVDGKLWFVNHMMTFHSGREPALARLVQRLRAKYGPPAKEAGPSAEGYRASWQFDAAGGAMTAPTGHCLADAAPFSAPGKDAAPQFQSKFTNDCPATVSVLALPTPGDASLVARLQVILSAPEPMFQHLKQMDAALAAKKAAESHPAGN